MLVARPVWFLHHAEQRFQCAEEAAQQPWLCRSAGVAVAALGAGATTGAAGSVGLELAAHPAWQRLPAQVVQTLTFSELFFRRQRHRFFMQLGSM